MVKKIIKLTFPNQSKEETFELNQSIMKKIYSV